jgi:outer membrane biosynthesis protein TonB
LLERAQEFFLGLHARLPGSGGSGDAGVSQIAAAGGSRGAGMAALAKALAICAGTVGGAAACVATGVAPAPLGIEPEHATEARIERVSPRAEEELAAPPATYEPAPEPEPQPQPESRTEPAPEPEPAPPLPEASETGAVEYAPPEESAPSPAAEPAGGSGGGAAGEFGP